jgi:hypothetical protein
MSFQCFSRQARGDSLRNSRGGSSHVEKEHVVYNTGGVLIYWCPDKEIPPQGRASSPLHFVPSAICD